VCEYRPAFWPGEGAPVHSVIRRWAGGFSVAMTLAPEAWGRLIEDERTQDLVVPFIGFFEPNARAAQPALSFASTKVGSTRCAPRTSSSGMVMLEWRAGWHWLLPDQNRKGHAPEDEGQRRLRRRASARRSGPFPFMHRPSSSGLLQATGVLWDSPVGCEPWARSKASSPSSHELNA
jgi:hypothetical protein